MGHQVTAPVLPFSLFLGKYHIVVVSVKGKNCLWNTLSFEAHIEDLRSRDRKRGENSKAGTPEEVNGDQLKI